MTDFRTGSTYREIKIDVDLKWKIVEESHAYGSTHVTERTSAHEIEGYKVNGRDVSRTQLIAVFGEEFVKEVEDDAIEDASWT